VAPIVPWALCTCAELSRVPTSAQQQFESGPQCQSAPASLPPPAGLQRQTFRFSFALPSLYTLMAHQLVSLVQHRASSSQTSRGLPVELPGS
jgi:hypothetical protein